MAWSVCRKSTTKPIPHPLLPKALPHCKINSQPKVGCSWLPPCRWVIHLLKQDSDPAPNDKLQALPKPWPVFAVLTSVRSTTLTLKMPILKSLHGRHRSMEHRQIFSRTLGCPLRTCCMDSCCQVEMMQLSCWQRTWVQCCILTRQATSS